MIRDEIQLRKKTVKNSNTTKISTPMKTGYKVLLNAEQFRIMLDYALQHDGDIQRFILDYWCRVFENVPLPKDKTLQELKIAIHYGLVYQAYMQHGIKMSDKFLKNYDNAINFRETLLSKCDKESKMSQIIISQSQTLNEGVDMAVKKSKKIAVSPKTKGEVKPKMKMKLEPEPEVKLKNSSMAGFIRELLFEQKFTDKEICEKALQKFPDKKPHLHINNIRIRWNAGKPKGLSKKIDKIL